MEDLRDDDIVNILFWLDFTSVFFFPLSKNEKAKISCNDPSFVSLSELQGKRWNQDSTKEKNIYLVYISQHCFEKELIKNRLGTKIFFKENCIQLKGQSHFILAVSLKKFFNALFQQLVYSIRFKKNFVKNSLGLEKSSLNWNEIVY